MGRQSARMWFDEKEHKEIYFDGHYHDKMYLGSELVWEKYRQRPAYTQYFILEDIIIPAFGNHPVDEYGAYLSVNPGAVIEKCGVYLHLLGGKFSARSFGCVGTGITYIRHIPYLAYRGEVVYEGPPSGEPFVLPNAYEILPRESYVPIFTLPYTEQGSLVFHTFDLSCDYYGVWMYTDAQTGLYEYINTPYTVLCDMEDNCAQIPVNGARSTNTRIFYDSNQWYSWLHS